MEWLIAALYGLCAVEKSLSFVSSETGRLLYKNKRRKGWFFFFSFVQPIAWPVTSLLKCFQSLWMILTYREPPEEDDEDLPI